MELDEINKGHGKKKSDFMNYAETSPWTSWWSPCDHSPVSEIIGIRKKKAKNFTMHQL